MNRQQGIGMTSMRTRVRLIERLSEQGITDVAVLDLIQSTPRHLFVEEALSHRAYEDRSLPIGFGQTISQPYSVAKMTALLFENGPLEKVLEIGTGSGYQTALLAPLSKQVFTTERIAPLQQRSKALLHSMGIRNVHFALSDGGLGLEQKAPFDGIISTCAPEEIPESLLNQLSPEGGRLVIPVGRQEQMLMLVTRDGDTFTHKAIEPVVFVPLLKGLVS
jgi:protein-L-isoaspartate(D-aspartate) O-methyltransferase